ncbi:MAG: SLC13 family permease, partial [Alphaproteobacteria bacterium]|nr:SLC13 family permease [Alphaproteobacteria bacterium]
EEHFLSELIISDSTDLVGKTLGDVRGRDADVLRLIREEEVTQNPPDNLTLQPRDRLIVLAPAHQAVRMRERAAPDEGSYRSDEEYRRDLMRSGFELVNDSTTVLREGIVGPDSRFEGRTISGLNLRGLYNLRILAVRRRRDELDEDFQDIRLRFGDTVLMKGAQRDFDRLFNTGDLVNLSEPNFVRKRPQKAPLALGAVAAVMILATMGVLPIVGLALLAAIFVVATGCLTSDEAYRAVDWRILFLIFGMLAVGRALQETGAAELIITSAADLVAGFGPYIVLAVIYGISSLLTESVTNNGVAVIITPLVIGLAEQMGVDPRPFVVAVMFAASASFATPLGYQTNTFVYGAGNYRFSDFIRVGLPLNVIM